YMTVRTLGHKRERPITVVMAFPLVAGPLSFPFAAAVWRWPSALEWGAMVAAAVAAAGGAMCLTIGVQGAKVAPATTATYVGFVFGSAVGWLAWGEAPAGQPLAGAAAMGAGVAVIARRAAAPAEDLPLDPALDPEGDPLTGRRRTARASARGGRAGT